MEFEPLVEIGKTGKFSINFWIQWRKPLNWFWCHNLWGIISNFSAPNVITAIQFGAENGQNENELFELEKIKNAFQRKKATINVGGNGFWKTRNGSGNHVVRKLVFSISFWEA